MPTNNRSLILEQRLVKHAGAALHFRETSLQLSEDQCELVLSHYSEHYSHEGVQWVEHNHRVSVAEMLNWLTRHGKPQTLAQSGPTNSMRK